MHIIPGSLYTLVLFLTCFMGSTPDVRAKHLVIESGLGSFSVRRYIRLLYRTRYIVVMYILIPVQYAEQTAYWGNRSHMHSPLCIVCCVVVDVVGVREYHYHCCCSACLLTALYFIPELNHMGIPGNQATLAYRTVEFSTPEV